MTLLVNIRGQTAFQFAKLVTAALLTLVLLQKGSFAGEKWVSTGFGGSEDSFYSYGGFTYAPLGRLDKSGLRAKVWSKAYRFTYNTAVAPGAEVEIAAHGLGLEGERGWQVIEPEWRFAFYVGAVWRDHELTPVAPPRVIR